jgi:hypothetical protein
MTRSAMAMLWESWMTTRWAYLSRLVIVLAFVLLFSTLYEARDKITEDDRDILRVLVFIIIALGALSGFGVGRSQDGRGGFPFYLGFSRPASTWLQVIVPMSYRTVCCTALYLVPILITHLVYDMPALTVSACVLMIPITLMTIAANWWSDRKGISQLIAWVSIPCCATALIYYTLHFNDHTYSEDPKSLWWWSFSFSPQDYLILVLVSVSAVVLTLAGVERQRHGDDGFGFWPTKATDNSQKGDADLLTDLYQTECPTTSAKRAELWSEINGHGLPVIVWCLTAALIMPTLWLLSNLLDSPLFFGVVTIIILHIPLIKGTPTFGIRVKQGSAYMSTFDATRPLNTAWLTGVKLGVSTVSMTLGALLIGISFWVSTPLVEGFVEVVAAFKLFILDNIASKPAGEFVLWVMVTLVQLATMIAFLASLQALYALYSSRLTFSILGLIIYANFLPVMIATKVFPVVVGVAHIWFLAGLIAAGAIYYIQSLAKNQVLNSRQIVVFVFMWTLYALAYFYLLRVDGLLEPDTPAVFIAFRAGVCMLTLAIFAMAPWSLSMARHR